MSYNDFGPSKILHSNELAKLWANPQFNVFVPVGVFSEKLQTKVYMVCATGTNIWVTQAEALEMFDKRIAAAIDRYLNEILYDILPDSDDEFYFQNGINLREVTDPESWD